MKQCDVPAKVIGAGVFGVKGGFDLWECFPRLGRFLQSLQAGGIEPGRSPQRSSFVWIPDLY